MTSTDIAAASKVMLGTTEAVAMYIGSTKIWPTGGGQQQHDYSQDYFTIESLQDNNEIPMHKVGGTGINPTLSYSLDDGETWTTTTISSSKSFGTINTGQKIIFKGTNVTFASAWNAYNYFNPSKQFKVYGNIMSLFNGDNFKTNYEFNSDSTHNCAGLLRTKYLVDASNLILPALTCNENCYNGMFRGCTNLTAAPQLPATQSALSCYSSMFEGDINLEVAPEINLVNMSQESCMRMFCMSRTSKITTPKMTKSPILRCKTSATDCYKEMFRGNGNLVEVTCLLTNPAGTAAWLTDCSTSGTFYKASGVTWSTGNTNNIPSGWTVQDYVEPS